MFSGMFPPIALVFVLQLMLVCETTPRRAIRYRPPKPRFEVYKPKGLIVWIPAENGITQFSFHAKLNQRFWDDYESGHWAQTINRPKDGRFVFVDRKAELKLGDTIYFRTMITHNGVTYRGNHGIYEVSRYSGSNAGAGGGSRFPLSSSTLPPFVYKNNERRTKGVDQDAYVPMGPFDYESGEHRSPPLIRTRTIATQTSEEEIGHKECDRAQTMINGRKICSGRLIFEENFDTRLLNQQKWRIENRFASDPDNEFVVYADFQENIQLRNGKLVIKPTLFEDKFGAGSINTKFMFAEECTGVLNSRDCIRDRQIDFDMIPPILSAQISTYNSFKFIYGKILIRAKLPKGDWIFPQLYLRPSSEFYGRDEYASGLIRIAFIPGGPRLRNQLSGGLILNNVEPLRSAKICTLTRTYNWSENYHQFGLSWSPRGIYMEVDGEVYCHIEPEQGFYKEIVSSKPQIANLWKLSRNPMAPFDKEFYISLGVGVGGHYDFHDFQGKPWKDLSVKAMHSFWSARGNWYPTWNLDSALLVDYIKVYAI
ncbi:beta-1,3-glucan-binding protein 2-like [Toxorhynchites rutilus septentrionalis]|uniref:beta-1,3-glucan-binding protein 2-like n=1 Tax=Toxorhynchites rutilus septentrionalis TaxID=329112 RepID=UPI002479037E|nr:beta-1,3-glucan-binding protein 2-like [Toxorhynchites rutilus septentrionalis]